jgi:hypothetical protein
MERIILTTDTEVILYPLDLLKEYLKTLDEVQLCELLDIAAEDLVDRFADKIRDRRAYLTKELELMNEITDARAEDFVDEEFEEDEWN